MTRPEPSRSRPGCSTVRPSGWMKVFRCTTAETSSSSETRCAAAGRPVRTRDAVSAINQRRARPPIRMTASIEGRGDEYTPPSAEYDPADRPLADKGERNEHEQALAVGGGAPASRRWAKP